MRKEFSNIIEKLAKEDESIVFITGDLGYSAFESLQQTLKERFINAGVAEQNMIGVAAGMAYKGYKVFCYSIAPFIVYRALEQFRNDVCFHNLPVFLVGNGGGYGYGIMGPSHHALEDIAILSGQPNNTCYVPSFIDDLEYSIKKMVLRSGPAYLRLGLGQTYPEPVTKMENFNQIINNSESKGVIISSGPIANNIMEALNGVNLTKQFDWFTATEFPIKSLPLALVNKIKKTKKLLIIEEHIKTGGLAEQLSAFLLSNDIKINYFKSLCAKGYPGGLYGNQNYHQNTSGIDSSSIKEELLLMKL